MKPIKFKGHNAVYAENQEEYIPLPVCQELTKEGSVVSCWQLSFWERIKILFTGKFFFRQLTFGDPLQPICPMTDWKEGICINCGAPIGEHKHTTRYSCPSRSN